jgi:hypothetical protein
MVSWGSLVSSDCTSVSLRCRSVEKGFCSKESKFGSPAPGTMNVLIPWEWPVAEKARTCDTRLKLSRKQEALHGTVPAQSTSSSGRNATLCTFTLDSRLFVAAAAPAPDASAALGVRIECVR